MQEATVTSASVASNEAALVRAQVRQLYDHANIGFIATIVNALILGGILREVVESTSLLIWLAVLTILTIGRWVHVEIYRRTAAPLDDLKWGLAFVVGIGISGVVWGGAGYFLYPDSQPHQTFIAFVLGGMVAGAAVTFSMRMDAFLAFTVPALLPWIVSSFRVGDTMHIAMGTMVALFGLLLSGVAYRLHCLFKRSSGLWSQVQDLETQVDSLEHELHYGPIVSRSWLKDATTKKRETVIEIDTKARAQLVDLVDAFSELRERAERLARTRAATDVKQQKLEALSTFAHGIAVVLKNPIHIILANVARLKKTFENVVPIKHQEKAALSITLKDLARHLIVLDATLHELSHNVGLLEHTRLRLSDLANDELGTYRAADMSRVVNEAIDDWLETIDEPPIVDRRFAKDLPELVVDAEQIKTALTVLLDNGLEASSDERLQVRTLLKSTTDIDLTESSLYIRRPVDWYVFVEVQNDGLGLTRETAERMFDPFYTTKKLGRGLGLATVAAIMRRHHGIVTTEGSNQARCSIRLYFPVDSGSSTVKELFLDAYEETTIIE